MYHDRKDSHEYVTWLKRPCVPSLFQRTEARPLLGFGVKAFHRVEQLPIGAPTDGIDLLIHGGIAADLKENRETMVKSSFTLIFFIPKSMHMFGIITLEQNHWNKKTGSFSMNQGCSWVTWNHKEINYRNYCHVRSKFTFTANLKWPILILFLFNTKNKSVSAGWFPWDTPAYHHSTRWDRSRRRSRTKSCWLMSEVQV